MTKPGRAAAASRRKQDQVEAELERAVTWGQPSLLLLPVLVGPLSLALHWQDPNCPP